MIVARTEGRAIVYCEGAFGTTNGKTAHGLVRRSERWEVAAVVDSRHAGDDAGRVLDDRPAGIPIVPDLESALAKARETGGPATHLVIGLAPDGGRLPASARTDVLRAIEAGLHVVSGLHDLLGDDAELVAAARERGVVLHDVRRPPARQDLHFFSGKILEVDALVVGLLGTDSAVGKRTTAWLLVDALRAAGRSAELVGTGQTAWMQGASYSLVTDALISDFMTGEIEHAVWSCWRDRRPDVIVIEGQGSLLHPAYPGGYEVLAGGRPHALVLQHAPARKVYDGFPDFPLDPLPRQIEAVEMISGRPVVALTLNHEDLTPGALRREIARLREETGRPVCDPLRDGCNEVVAALRPHLEERRGR